MEKDQASGDNTIRHLNIALMGDVFYKWDGGTDYITNVAVVLDKLDKIISEDTKTVFKLNVFLFLPKDSRFVKFVKKIVGQDDEVLKKRLEDNVRSAGLSLKTIYYPVIPRQRIMPDSGSELNRVCRGYDIDIVFPVMQECFPKLSIPWIGTVTDLQEEHLPELFDHGELRRRRHDNMMILRSGYVMTASKQAADDLRRYYPAGNVKLYPAPFAPIAPECLFETSYVDMEKYRLPTHFFVICNQFWMHKDHKCAFEALRILHEKGYTEVDIYCTGRMGDFRNEAYSEELKEFIEASPVREHIHMTGFIPKEEQAELIKRSLALLQPSHFEGNVGGQSVYLARSLCKDVILTDIDVNLEGMGDPFLHYCRCGDPVELADRMEEAIKKGVRYPSAEEMIKHNGESIGVQARFYGGMLSEVLDL